MNGYNFTEDVRRVLSGAREESVRLGHEYVGTEHLLLSLTREPPAGAGELLQRLGVDAIEARRTVEGIIRPGRAHDRSAPELPYTSRAKKSLELAMKEARERGDNYVGTEHLLAGLLREEKGIAAQVLAHSGLTLDALRTEELRRSQERAGGSQDARPLPSESIPVATPRRLRPVRAALAGASFALGAVWATAGAMKLIFGTAVTFVLLPPFGLENVSAGSSLIIGLVLFAIGAFLRRKRIW